MLKKRFLIILIMCVIGDREIHQRIAISLVVKVQIEFWDTEFQIPGLDQWNKEPLCLSSTSAMSFLIITVSYQSVSKPVSQIYEERTLKYLGLYYFQTTDLKLWTLMGLKTTSFFLFFSKSPFYPENCLIRLWKLQTFSFLVQFNSTILLQILRKNFLCSSFHIQEITLQPLILGT